MQVSAVSCSWMGQERVGGGNIPGGGGGEEGNVMEGVPETGGDLG